MGSRRNIYLPKDLLTELDKKAEKDNDKKSRIIQRALRKYLSEPDEKANLEELILEEKKTNNKILIYLERLADEMDIDLEPEEDSDSENDESEDSDSDDSDLEDSEDDEPLFTW